MHDRAKEVGTRSTRQNAPDQTFGTPRTSFATGLFFRRGVRLRDRVFAHEIQADRQRVAHPSHHFLGAFQVEKTARHVRVGIGFINLVQIRFQDGDFGFSPVTRRLGLRCLGGFRSDLDATAIDRDHRHRWRRTLGVRDGIFVHEGKLFVRRDGGVALRNSLLADLHHQSFHRLGADLQIGQFGKIA